MAGDAGEFRHWATMRGWQAGIKDPDGGIAALMEAFPDTNREFARLGRPLVIEHMQSAATRGKPLGWMVEDDWRSTLDIVERDRGLEGDRPPSVFYTNEFIPTGSRCPHQQPCHRAERGLGLDLFLRMQRDAHDALQPTKADNKEHEWQPIVPIFMRAEPTPKPPGGESEEASPAPASGALTIDGQVYE